MRPFSPTNLLVTVVANHYYVCRPGISYKFTPHTNDVWQTNSSAVLLWTSNSTSRSLEYSAADLLHSSTPLGLSLQESASQPSPQARDGLCSNVKIECSGQPCGIRPRFNAAGYLPSTEGQWPWHASLFLNENYTCGATLVSPRWLITSVECLLAVEYVRAIKFHRWYRTDSIVSLSVSVSR